MKHTVTITPMDDYILVSVAGDVSSLQEIIDYSIEYRAAAVEHSLRKVLLDYTAATVQVDYHDLMVLADHAASKNFHLDGLRLASLVQQHDLESHRLFETVARNRSISFKAFTDKAQALKWLRRP